jgi:hypothetical protein
MAFLRYERCFLCMAVLVSAGLTSVQSPPARPSDAKQPAPAFQEANKTVVGPPAPAVEKKPAPPPPTLETLKLPNGTVVVICKDFEEARRHVPDAIMLSPEQYQSLRAEIEQLKQQLKPATPAQPSSCRLTGRVDADLVHLQAVFEFKTQQPNALVNLGCQRAWPVAASLDGQVPWLQVSDEGFLIQADSPGVHKASLDLLLPTRKGFKGADRGFHLDLPRAAISTLEQFDLPGGATEIRLGERLQPPGLADAQRSRLLHLAIVPIDYLELSWRGPSAEPAKGRPAVLAATGRFNVRVTETHVFTNAELTLQTLRGEPNQWRCQVALPGDALLEVKPQPQDVNRVAVIERSGTKQSTLVTVKLKTPSPEDLHLTFRFSQARQAGPVPLEPIVVLDALTQQGEIDIRAADDLRLHYPQMRSELSQREVSDEQRRDNVRHIFTYWSLPQRSDAAAPAVPLLSIQAEAVKGAVETRVQHQLRWIEAEGESRPQWRLLTRIDVTPVRTALDHLEVALPANLEFDRQTGWTPLELIEAATVDPATHMLLIKLAQKQLRPFALTLTGSYSLAHEQQQAVLELPRPLTWSVERSGPPERIPPPAAAPTNVLERGGQLQITLPENFELVSPHLAKLELEESRNSPVFPFRLPSFSNRTTGAGLRDYRWQSERAPERVELRWRPFRPELRVQGLVDVTLKHRQATVRQRLHLQSPGTVPATIWLRVPPSLGGRIRVAEGRTIVSESRDAGGNRSVSLSGPARKEQVLTLEYAVPRPGEDGTNRASRQTPHRFVLPLVQVVSATGGETKVRLWSDPREEPEAVGGHWEELPTEIVPERETLPVLVLRGGLENSVTLALTKPPALPLASAVLSRVVLRAQIGEDHSQTYLARFVLQSLSSPHVDVALPVPLTLRDVDVRLNDRGVPRHIVDESGREADSGKVIRLLVEPELYHAGSILEIRYTLDADHLEDHGGLLTTLHPPLLPGAVLLGQVRWFVDLPPAYMPILAGNGYQVEQQWGWWGPLLAPSPAVAGSELDSAMRGAQRPPSGPPREPGLVCWRTTLGALPIVTVPRRLWLLVCSLLLLGLGLALFFAPFTRTLFWLTVLAASVAVALVAIAWPAAVPALAFGCEPGAFWLLAVILLQWLLHERYRRQIVFMPGFTRVKSGSSLIRPGSSNRKRELSTVDEPPKRANSLNAGQGA